MSWVTEVDGLKHSFQGRCHGPLLKNCIHLVPPHQRLPFLRLQCLLFHLGCTSECSKLPKMWSLRVFSLGPLPQYYPMVLMISYFRYQAWSSLWASYLHVHCPLDISNLERLFLLSSSSAHVTFSYFTSQKMIPHSTNQNGYKKF